MSGLTDVQRAWVDALRSGEYKQGRNYLHGGDSFCCLGVACDLAVKAGLPVEVDAGNFCTYYDGCMTSLPESVTRWLGLKDALGWGGEAPLWARKTNLAHANDVGASFEEIAAIIEERAADLFEEVELHG